MEWQAYEIAPQDEGPEARMGHTATLVDCEGTWGEDLLVVFGKSLTATVHGRMAGTKRSFRRSSLLMRYQDLIQEHFDGRIQCN